MRDECISYKGRDWVGYKLISDIKLDIQDIELDISLIYNWI